MVPSSMPLLLFIILPIKRDMVHRKNSSYLFKGFFQKSFLHALAVLRYLPKLKTDLGLAFGAHFLRTFFHKNIAYLKLYQLTKFHYQT